MSEARKNLRPGFIGSFDDPITASKEVEDAIDMCRQILINQHLYSPVSLTASDSKVYILSKEGLTSLESSNPVDSQELQSKNNAVRILAGLFHPRPPKKYSFSESKSFDKDYDYDSYYRDADINKFCYGDKCYLYIPEKGEFIETKPNKNKKYEGHPYTAYLVEDRKDKEDPSKVNDGYERDDEDDEVHLRSGSNSCSGLRNSDCYRRSSTTKPTKTEPTTAEPATTKRYKTIDEKTTAELTSADLDAIVPDSFEQRIDNDYAEGQRKFSTDYIDINDLYKIIMRSNQPSNQTQQKSFSNVEDLLAPVMRYGDTDAEENSDEIGKVYSKEYLRELRRPGEQTEEESREGRKWGIKKSAFRKKRFTTTSPSSGSSGESDENIPAEDSDTEHDSVSQSRETPTKNKKKSNRFKVVKHTKTAAASLSKENNEFEKKDTTETMESVSVEVKPKPAKKKSKSRIPGKPEHYMQSHSRLYKEGKDFRKKKEEFDDFLLGLRKRMPHFLPKRYHWDPSEFQKLGYFWFNGPQGKNPGPWKIAY